MIDLGDATLLPGFIDALGPKAEGILEPIQWAANAPYKDEIDLALKLLDAVLRRCVD